MADEKDKQQISAELDAALDRRDDLYNDPISAASKLGSEYQADSLKDQEGITDNFQDKADPLYAPQKAEMEKNDLERAEGTGEGSKMISEDGNRHDMHPPSDMRAEADRASFDERMAKDGIPSSDLDAALDRRDDLYDHGPGGPDGTGPEFDSRHKNGSDYNDEYEP